jgi:hypothetical protein
VGNLTFCKKGGEVDIILYESVEKEQKVNLSLRLKVMPGFCFHLIVIASWNFVIVIAK